MTSAKETQVGGDHYKSLKIQPVDYIHANGIGYMEGNVIKYVTRWRSKGGLADLEKARHYIDLLIQLESSENVCLQTQYKPDWSKAPDWAQWWSVDECGTAYWWESEPTVKSGSSHWNANGGLEFYGKVIDNPAWRLSLHKRPESK